MSLNKLLAVIYSDLFDFPLTPKEANFWQIQPGLSRKKSKTKTVVIKGYEVLAGREGLVGKRTKRQIYSKEKEETARDVTKLLRIIPSIYGIFLTGSVAAQNAKKGADIDLMIITNSQTLWLTRIVVVLVLKIKGLYREKRSVGDRICTNIYLDTNHLKIGEQNLFTAHEVLQAKCLYDQGGVEKRWVLENKWTRDYLPTAYDGVRIKDNEPFSRRNTLYVFRYTILLFETIVFFVQYLYMKPKMTNERVGWGYAYFHPNDLSKKILTKFKKRLRSLGIM